MSFNESRANQLRDLVEAAAAVRYAKSDSGSHAAVIRVYDDAGNMIETHEHAGESWDRARIVFDCRMADSPAMICTHATAKTS